MKLILAVAIFAIFALFASVDCKRKGDGTKKSNKVKPYFDIRLPEYVKPLHYNVFLNVNMISKDVNGKVTVNISLTKPTSYIFLHAVGYVYMSGKIYDKNDQEIAVSKEFYYTKNQYYVLKVKEKLPIGDYVLHYNFTYKLNKKLAGFYRAKYKTKDGGKKMAAVTQFQPTDARLAFPCFDEPIFRASFDITIGHDKGYIAISNMPIESTTFDKANPSIRYDKFQRTPVMSTYILSFTVCQFSHLTVISKLKIPINMTFYAPPDQISQINYASEAGSKILPYFEQYYNISYPLPKADMLAVPDFALGGMENWGIVSYRLKGLLYDPLKLPLKSKVYVCSLMSHELAHQWFGNLVTMSWWSDLWLNEGFASHMTFKGVHAIHPEWQYPDIQVTDDMEAAMKLDALFSSHPIYVNVANPAQINEVFDAISYSKGSSVLRMLEHFLGEKNFVKGLNRYLKKYAYKNAKSGDLWEELSKVSHSTEEKYNVSKIMNTWILQKNFPVVDVSRTTNGSFILTQSRFLSDSSAKYDSGKSPFNYKWYIPFNYKLFDVVNSSNITPVEEDKVWLNMADASINSSTKTSFMKGNLEQYGFFRVNYDEEGWNNLISLLETNHKLLDVKDRAGLIQDAFALAGSGRIDYSVALRLIDYIDNDSDYIPWLSARNSLYKIKSIISQSPRSLRLIRKFIKSKTNNLFNRFAFKDVKEFLPRNLQVLIAELSCESGHVPCLKNASSMFNKWMNNDEQIPSDFKKLIYYYGVRNGDEKEWNFIFNQYMRTTVPYEKFTLLQALCATMQPDIMDRMLYYSFNASIIKSQDSFYVYSYIAQNSPHGRYQAWYFLKENWKQVVKRFSHQFHTLSRILKSVVSGFTTKHAQKQVLNFFTQGRTKGTGQIKSSLKQSLENVKTNIQWLKINKLSVEKWLKSTK